MRNVRQFIKFTKFMYMCEVFRQLFDELVT